MQDSSTGDTDLFVEVQDFFPIRTVLKKKHSTLRGIHESSVRTVTNPKTIVPQHNPRFFSLHPNAPSHEFRSRTPNTASSSPNEQHSHGSLFCTHLICPPPITDVNIWFLKVVLFLFAVMEREPWSMNHDPSIRAVCTFVQVVVPRKPFASSDRETCDESNHSVTDKNGDARAD